MLAPLTGKVVAKVPVRYVSKALQGTVQANLVELNRAQLQRFIDAREMLWPTINNVEQVVPQVIAKLFKMAGKIGLGKNRSIMALTFNDRLLGYAIVGKSKTLIGRKPSVSIDFLETASFNRARLLHEPGKRVEGQFQGIVEGLIGGLAKQYPGSRILWRPLDSSRNNRFERALKNATGSGSEPYWRGLVRLIPASRVLELGAKHTHALSKPVDPAVVKAAEKALQHQPTINITA